MLMIKRASTIKLNSTLTLTLVLLILMLGAGYGSAIWGFTVGLEALKGVNQPDARPTNKIKLRKKSSQQQRGVVMLKEEDILTNVRARIEGKGNKVKPEKVQQENPRSTKHSSSQTKQTTQEISQPGFPLIGKNQGVTLEVLSARFSGGALQLRVNFKNEGEKTVRFLSSFLDVTDDRGRALSANTEGLPWELPPNGKIFSGTVSISTTLLDDVNKLSMTLTDYPEQRLRLQMIDIPVNR